MGCTSPTAFSPQRRLCSAAIWIWDWIPISTSVFSSNLGTLLPEPLLAFEESSKAEQLLGGRNRADPSPYGCLRFSPSPLDLCKPEGGRRSIEDGRHGHGVMDIEKDPPAKQARRPREAMELDAIASAVGEGGPRSTRRRTLGGWATRDGRSPMPPTSSFGASPSTPACSLSFSVGRPSGCCS